MIKLGLLVKPKPFQVQWFDDENIYVPLEIWSKWKKFLTHTKTPHRVADFAKQNPKEKQRKLRSSQKQRVRYRWRQEEGTRWSGTCGRRTQRIRSSSSTSPSVTSPPAASRWSSSPISPPKPPKISGTPTVTLYSLYLNLPTNQIRIIEILVLLLKRIYFFFLCVMWQAVLHRRVQVKGHCN